MKIIAPPPSGMELIPTYDFLNMSIIHAHLYKNIFVATLIAKNRSLIIRLDQSFFLKLMKLCLLIYLQQNVLLIYTRAQYNQQSCLRFHHSTGLSTTNYISDLNLCKIRTSVD